MVLADSSKVGNENFAQVAELKDVDMLITDSAADPAAMAELTETGLEIIEVGSESGTEP